jgi:hypothetical protein
MVNSSHSDLDRSSNFGITKPLDENVGPIGWTGKVTYLMIWQLMMAVYYVAGFVINIRHSNEYYIWPERNGTKSENEFFLFRTDVDYFECEGYNLYRADQGPRPDPSKKPDTGENIEVLQVTVYLSVPLSFFLLFCFKKLYYGHYNQLIGFVTFDSKAFYPPKVVSFAVGYTVMFNFSKGALGLFLDSRCGYMSFGAFMFSEFYQANSIRSIIEFLAAAIFLLCLLATWVCIAIYSLINFDRFGSETQTKLFWSIRCMIVACVLSYWLTILMRFDPVVNFDIKYPNWVAVCVVSYLDLLTSTFKDFFYFFVGRSNQSSEIVSTAGNIGHINEDWDNNQNQQSVNVDENQM